MAAELALIYMIDSGCAEYPVDFQQRYNASWLSVAVLGAIACNCGDTFASEIGSVVGSSEPWLLLTFRQVPKGLCWNTWTNPFYKSYSKNFCKCPLYRQIAQVSCSIFPSCVMFSFLKFMSMQSYGSAVLESKEGLCQLHIILSPSMTVLKT